MLRYCSRFEASGIGNLTRIDGSRNKSKKNVLYNYQ